MCPKKVILIEAEFERSFITYLLSPSWGVDAKQGWRIIEALRGGRVKLASVAMAAPSSSIRESNIQTGSTRQQWTGNSERVQIRNRGWGGGGGGGGAGF